MEDFISRCRYVRGQYDSVDDFHALAADELDSGANTLFYLAVPPAVFLPASRAIQEAGLAGRERQNAWTRVVIEKPFGSDRESSDALTDAGHGRCF